MLKALPQPDALLGRLDSLADPARLRLLHLLENHELAVAELCDVIQLPQSTVSRHLKILADQHWLKSRRDGTTHLYRMVAEDLDPASRRLWLLTREQTENWSAIAQDDLRLSRLLRNKQLDSQAFFATAATQWDNLRSELYGESFSMAASLSLIPSASIIADLGCGTGHLTSSLAPHVSRVIAVDNSPAMLKAAKQRSADFSNVSLRRGELQSLPIDDSSCDAALMILSLTYVPEPADAIREMSRILKPSGKAILVDLLPHSRDDFRRQYGQLHPGFPPTEIKSLLTACGLASPSLHPLPPDPNTKGPALFLATAIKPQLPQTNNR